MRGRGLGYKHYLLALLLVIFASNQVDRMAMGLLLQDIKTDLTLSDTQLGLLSGMAFALFYSLMGVPIARWADRGNRVTIISVTTALWSAAVALCGAAASFVQLLVIRICVAVGEAGCVPPAHSLIADHFGRAERPRAVSIYMLGGPLSVLVGYLLAGWLNQAYGWRMTFVLLGLPGVALALLAWLTLREPRRVQPERPFPSPPPSPPEPTLALVFVTLWASRTFRHLLFCFAVASFFGAGFASWQPAFLVRSHGLQSGEIGTWFAAIYGFGGFCGTYLGGALASRYAANDERLQLRAMSILFSAFALLCTGIYLSSHHYLAFGFMGLAALGGAATNGPLFATLQTLVPERMRATAIALIYLCANLIGLGLGPLAVGLMSDALHPLLGEESLRYALLALCPGYLWAAWHLWRASLSIDHDLELQHLSTPC